MRLFVLLVLAGSLFVAACSTRAGNEQTSPTAPANADQANTASGLAENPASGQPDTSSTLLTEIEPADNDSDEPPAAFIIREDGERFEGARGSYYWSNGASSVWVDAFDPVSNVDPITLQSGEKISLGYPGRASDRDIVAWFAAEQIPPDSDAQVLFWGQIEGWGPNLDASGLVAPSQPGHYLMALFTHWSPRSNSRYGFFVEVQ